MKFHPHFHALFLRPSSSFKFLPFRYHGSLSALAHRHIARCICAINLTVSPRICFASPAEI